MLAVLVCNSFHLYVDVPKSEPSALYVPGWCPKCTQPFVASEALPNKTNWSPTACAIYVIKIAFVKPFKLCQPIVSPGTFSAAIPAK